MASASNSVRSVKVQNGGYFYCAPGLQLLLKPRNVLKALIPAPFEFTSNKSIFLDRSHHTAFGRGQLILRMLQHELGLANNAVLFC